MADQYGDLTALKTRLGIEPSDTSRDPLLTSALSAASRSIDRATGRRFWLDAAPTARTYRLHQRICREDDGDVLLVDDIGDADMTVESTSTGGGTYTAVTGYETTPDNALTDGRPITGLLRPLTIWGTTFTRVRVTARFGWPTVPDDVTEACLIQASRLFKRKDSPEGVMGSTEWGVIRLSRRDPDVWNLIEPYVQPGFG